MSRVVERKNCPHCKAKLPEPTPRMCPECAGSLQKRFLSLGCFTTAPPIVLALIGAGLLARAGPNDDAHAHEANVSARAPAAIDLAAPESDASAASRFAGEIESANPDLR